MEIKNKILCTKCNRELPSFELKYYSKTKGCFECRKKQREEKKIKRLKTEKIKNDKNKENIFSLLIGLIFMFPIMFLPLGINYIWAILILVIWKMFKVEWND